MSCTDILPTARASDVAMNAIGDGHRDGIWRTCSKALRRYQDITA